MEYKKGKRGRAEDATRSLDGVLIAAKQQPDNSWTGGVNGERGRLLSNKKAVTKQKLAFICF